MMSNNDAECLLDENFIAMDESFDRLEDDSNRFFAESNKYKKKNGFHFTSSWRKPKMGRRKTKSIGKSLVDSSYDMSMNEYNDFPMNDDSTRGKIVKGRGSFDSFASVPLSDFDHVKDNLAFMNFRSGNNSNRTKSPKEKLNPKMFLTQAPINRRDIKNKFKKDRVARKKLEDEEPRDIFKPIHNTNMNNDNVFDAFQILPKESPNKSKPKESAPIKMKPKEEPVKKQKEEPVDDLYDKENLSKESFYCDDLYNDHGPILSSLSEDTFNSDSVRGEQFLEDEEPKNQCGSLLSPTFEEVSKDTWEMPVVSNQNFVQPAKKVEPLIRPAKVESSVGSFKDRLQQFQTKDTQPISKVRSDPIKPKPISTVLDSKVVNEEEAPEDEARASIESAFVENESAPEKIASDKLEASTISKPDEQASTNEKKVETSKWKTSSTSYYNRYGGYSKPSGALNNRFKEQMQTNSGTKATTSSSQADSYKRINQQKSFGENEASDISKKKIIVQSSDKVKSSVVDLSMLETFRKNQAASKSVDRDSSVSQRTSTEPSVSVEEEKVESNKVERDSGVSIRLSEFSTRSSRSYMSNYRPSTSSYKSTSQAPSWARRETKPKESAPKPELETVTKSESSGSATQHSEIVSCDESKDQSAVVEKETKAAEKKQENAHDSFRAARMRFGGKLQQNRKKFEKNVVSNMQKQENSEEKKETSDSTSRIQLDSSEVEDTKKNSGAVAANKSFESLKSEVTADERTSISSTGVRKNATKPFFAKKSSFDPTPKKSNVESSKPSLEISEPPAKVVDTTSLETEKKSVPKRDTSNESTANTSISTLTVDSAPRSSYAQQSASIFGVTLSKRKKRIKGVLEPMESPTKKQAIGPHILAKKSDFNSVSTKLPSTEPASELDEEELPVQEKKKCFGEEDAKRKISTSSVSVHSVEIKAKQETSEHKEEEKPRVVDRFPLKNSRQETKSDASDLKIKTTSFPRKVKTSSIADRLKMFDKPSVANQVESNSDDNVEEAETSDSPKSIMTSGSTSSFEVSSVATKRRETGSGLISESDIVQNEVEKVEASPYNALSYRKYSNDNENDEVSERRRTLKSVRRTTNVSSSFKPQPASEVVNKPEVQKKNLYKFGNDNSLRARLSTLRTLKSEDQEDSKDEVKRSFNIEPKAESKVAQLKKSFKSEAKEEIKLLEKAHNSEDEEESKVELSPKTPSPPTRDAYSMRRKFFENLDRKRVQASMSRPLITQTESMSTNHQSEKGHEIEIIGDDILRENNDLPMCVEFEEDFMLRDNISTCLSASENRSVVCKPDALLYSVSQKAIALMAAKAESNSMRSYSRTYHEDEKGTIDNGLKFNRFKSSGSAGSSNYSELRNRFSQRNTERETSDDVQKQDTNKYQQTNKFGKSDFAQRSNRFTSNKVDDETDKKYDSSEDNETVEKSTTGGSFNQSKYNRFSGNKTETDTTKTVDDTPVTTYNCQPKDIGSMTVSERLEFFKSQRKRRAAATKKPEKEEPKSLDDSRKSSASSFKNRPSDASEMTPLVGVGFSEQSIITSLKRVSSNSMGTLDYSMQSSSDYSKNRVSSASNNTHGTSSSRYNYRKGGYSSAAGNR